MGTQSTWGPRQGLQRSHLRHQNRLRFHHWQGQQALHLTSQGQGYQALHRRGERQETWQNLICICLYICGNKCNIEIKVPDAKKKKKKKKNPRGKKKKKKKKK